MNFRNLVDFIAGLPLKKYIIWIWKQPKNYKPNKNITWFISCNKYLVIFKANKILVHAQRNLKWNKK